MTENPLPPLGSTQHYTPASGSAASQPVTVIRHETANVTTVRGADGRTFPALNRELS